PASERMDASRRGNVRVDDPGNDVVAVERECRIAMTGGAAGADAGDPPAVDDQRARSENPVRQHQLRAGQYDHVCLAGDGRRTRKGSSRYYGSGTKNQEPGTNQPVQSVRTWSLRPASGRHSNSAPSLPFTGFA